MENYYQKYKEKIRKYQHEHKEQIREYQKRYQRDYYQKNKKKKRSHQKKYLQEHREEVLAYYKKYMQEHKEKITEYQKEYHKKRIEQKPYRQHGAILKKRLEDLCENQSWLARKLGISKEAVSKYMSGINFPRDKNVRKNLYRILMIDSSDL